MEFIGEVLAGLGEFIRRNVYKLLCAIFAILLVFSLYVNEELVNQVEESKSLAQSAVELCYSSLELAQNIQMEYSAYKAMVELEKESENTPPILEQQMLQVVATGYCPCVHCCGIWSEQHPCRQGTGYVQRTSSGTIPTANRTIATDPDVIPEGSVVLLNGIEYIAEDTGSGVEGAHIDIYFPTHEEALSWGCQTVEVIVVESNH